MLELSPQEKPDETVSADDSPAQDELSVLRQMLFSAEQAQLAELEDRLENHRRRAQDLSQVLSESITLRAAKDKSLTKALTPTVQEALTISVKKNPRSIVDAIFPVIGPAIRKAIANALREMVQSLNQALEYSLSVKGIKWRLEALRTSKSFAEVILSHTLLYRVEQVFLVHQQTGLLLHHVAATAVVSQDADMVSGMLTAIQDFVRDSFGTQGGEGLDALQVGELTVWIEQGPGALLAAVIRGNAPQEYRAVLQDAIETIHLEQGEDLEEFQGDATPFEASHAMLENCLQSQAEEKEKKTSPLLWVLVGVVVLALGLWLFFSLRSSWRWDEYLTKLNAEPGIVVVSQEKRGGKYFITGLRDPLAADPAEILKTTQVDPQTVIGRWENYQASHPDFVIARAVNLLQPPKTIALQFDKGVLAANGFASQTWLNEARKLAKMIPAVTSFQEDGIVDAGKELNSIKEKIEKQTVRFELGSAEIPDNQNEALDTLTTDLQKLQELTHFLSKEFRIEVFGQSDQAGSEQLNQRLEKDRATNVIARLTAKGINANNLSLTTAREAKQRNKTALEYDRKVSFKAFFTDTPDAK
jgi:outer membrane protein OmpA-like peptidoglycan-associated protein